MMPVALGLIWIELKAIDWIFQPVVRLKKYEFIKKNYLVAQQDAPLVMGRRKVRKAGDATSARVTVEPGPKPIPLPGEKLPGFAAAIPPPGGEPASGTEAIPLPGGESAS
jgi:hypothetical protein